jgi:hypothetical protein
MAMTDGETIPKIIWQTHEWEYKDLPENFLAATTTWKNLNPDWEYKYVSSKDRAEFVKRVNPSLYKIYLLHDKVSQADMWRYLVTYEHGGVYADMDSICTMPLTYQVDKYQNKAELIAIPIEDNKFVNNCNFAVIKSSIIMKKVLDRIIFRYKRIDYVDIMMHSRSKNEFWENFSRQAKLDTGPYIDVVLGEHKDLVSFNFIAAIHSESIKIRFNSDYDIDYYGQKTTYFKLAKKYGWETHIKI